MTKPIPPLDLLWLLIESPGSTTHVGALLLFKKPAGHRPVVQEIVEAYRAAKPAPPFNYVPELFGGGAPHFREVAGWDPHYHIQHLALPAGASYDDLLHLVAELHEPTLDRDRPLFRCWVIDGVPGACSRSTRRPITRSSMAPPACRSCTPASPSRRAARS